MFNVKIKTFFGLRGWKLYVLVASVLFFTGCVFAGVYYSRKVGLQDTRGWWSRKAPYWMGGRDAPVESFGDSVRKSFGRCSNAAKEAAKGGSSSLNASRSNSNTSTGWFNWFNSNSASVDDRTPYQRYAPCCFGGIPEGYSPSSGIVNRFRDSWYYSGFFGAAVMVFCGYLVVTTLFSIGDRVVNRHSYRCAQKASQRHFGGVSQSERLKAYNFVSRAVYRVSDVVNHAAWHRVKAHYGVKYGVKLANCGYQSDNVPTLFGLWFYDDSKPRKVKRMTEMKKMQQRKSQYGHTDDGGGQQQQHTRSVSSNINSKSGYTSHSRLYNGSRDSDSGGNGNGSNHGSDSDDDDVIIDKNNDNNNNDDDDTGFSFIKSMAKDTFGGGGGKKRRFSAAKSIIDKDIINNNFWWNWENGTDLSSVDPNSDEVIISDGTYDNACFTLAQKYGGAQGSVIYLRPDSNFKDKYEVLTLNISAFLNDKAIIVVNLKNKTKLRLRRCHNNGFFYNQKGTIFHIKSVTNFWKSGDGFKNLQDTSHFETQIDE